jgi:hypothetical protein
MTLFQHILWGYELTYPDPWIHQQAQDTDVFVAPNSPLDPYYSEQDGAQVVIRGEWNWSRQKVEPLWNQHIGKLAGMLGAKNVGSAPWHFRDASGLEAEIVLPKKDNRRLWTGVLTREFLVLHFLVTHPKEARETFEPAATKLITSLRFPIHIPNLITSAEALPLPPNYTQVDPQSILDDILEPQSWRAYQGNAGIGALQSFYIRELPAHHWTIQEYVPFPGASELGFARLKLKRDNINLTLGIMPSVIPESGADSGGANIVYKINEL